MYLDLKAKSVLLFSGFSPDFSTYLQINHRLMKGFSMFGNWNRISDTSNKGYVQPLKCCKLYHRMISLVCSINETPLNKTQKHLVHRLPQNSFRWVLAIQNNYRINTWHSQHSLQLAIHFLPKVFNEALFTALCRPAFLHKTESSLKDKGGNCSY